MDAFLFVFDGLSDWEASYAVAGICAATLALARAGILDQRRHTSNSPEYLAATD